MEDGSVLAHIRRKYHTKICEEVLGYRSNSRGLNVADSNNEFSKEIAEKLANIVGLPLCQNPPEGQTAGNKFMIFTKDFLEEAFTNHLQHLRPGNWIFSISQTSISSFEQYEHLSFLKTNRLLEVAKSIQSLEKISELPELQTVLQSYKDLISALSSDYTITPDITVARTPVEENELNSVEQIITSNENVARYSPLRTKNVGANTKILHASISCKWTMRSDRAQNTRTEALNLIRSRKGKIPHIVAVTFEPLPTRIASIAMGTGDIDCTYHAALPELLEAVAQTNRKDAQELLETLVDGKRLRDISDLPLDLCV